MKILNIIILVLFSNGLFAQETFPLNGVKNNFNPIYAFTNAYIVLDPDNIIEKGTMLVQGKKIMAIDSFLNIPIDAIVYDLAGDYIYPSFIELYTNYGLPKLNNKVAYNHKPQYKSNKKGAFHWNEAIHPEIDASNQFNSNPKTANNYHKNGFGSVLTHVTDGIHRGTGCLVLLSKESNQESIILSQAASFLSFKKGLSKQKNPTSLMGSIALIRQTLLDAEWYNNQKDQTNISYSSINKQQYLPHIFEANDELDYNRIYKIADEFEIDFIVKGNGKEYKIIDEISDSKLPLIIPINFPNAYDISNPDKSEWVSLKELKDWETAPFNASILEKNNISFCITSSGLDKDGDFIKRIRLAITKGLSKRTALAALTTYPAQLIKIDNKIGRLDKDMIANFFIASKDIFEDGVIYENWIAGKQNIITKKKTIDIRGYYSVVDSSFENKLVSITGTKAKPKIIIYDLDSLPLETNIEGNNITINTSGGKFRAISKFKNGIISGRYKDSLGYYHNLNMKRDSLFKESIKAFTLNIDSIIPSVWFPNKSHGFISVPKANNIIFRNATVWTNEDEGILKNTDVAIKEGKIIAIGDTLNTLKLFSISSEVIQINATNKHLTSGVIDEHSHIAISRGVNEGSQSVSAEVRIGDVINPYDHNIYRQLAGGTTASQLLHGSANPIGGQSAMIKLRWGSSAEQMKIKNSDGFIKFALGENVKQSNWGQYERVRFPQTRMGVEQVFYDAFYRAKTYQKLWEDFNNLSAKDKRITDSPREDLEMNALVEILKSKRFITCHSYIQSEINMLMHVGDSMGFKINTFTHILEGYKVAEKMKKHGAGGSTFSDWWAYKFEVNDAIPYNATLLNNAGVVTAINSDDAEMGRRLNQEAAKAVKYGNTSEEEAWKMITLNPAKLLHLDDRMGSIKVGKDADIVLWTKNPLSIYAKVIQTYVDGKVMFDVEIDKQLRNRDRIERMRIIQKMSKDKSGEKKQEPKITKEKLYHCDTEYDE